MANTYLSRVPTSTGSRTTFTYSIWVKRFRTGAQEMTLVIKMEGSGSDTNATGNADYLGLLYFNSDDIITVANGRIILMFLLQTYREI